MSDQNVKPTPRTGGTTPHITFVGTLPPPVTGMTLATRIVIDALTAKTDVRVDSVSWKQGWSPTRWKMGKALHAAAALQRLRRWRSERPAADARLYIVANSGLGLLYTLATVREARRLNMRVVMHHQVYSYVDRHSALMAAVVRAGGSHTTHVVLCDRMAKEFSVRYPEATRTFVFPNPIEPPPPALERTPGSEFRIGHLANLTTEKGVDLAIETFAALRANGHDVRLILAGPVQTPEAREALRAAQAAHGDRVDYRGPVYGDAKDRFFADCDAFVFPTRYRNEAYPLVITEALARGIPTIATARGCIRDQLPPALAIEESTDFVNRAVPVIAGWITDRVAHAAARSAARENGRAQFQRSERSLMGLVAALCDPAGLS